MDAPEEHLSPVQLLDSPALSFSVFSVIHILICFGSPIVAASVKG